LLDVGFWILEVMSIFKNIDELLKIFARKINAKLTIDRPYSLNTFEERRIDWKDNKIDKSILIQPNFERDGVNSKKWNLTLVAWFYIDNEDRLQWISYLVEEKKIKVIESDIENLLKISYEKLKNIKIDDLSKPY